MIELIEKLNKIYYIQRAISYDNSFWSEFEELVSTIKKKGFSFRHLYYDDSTFEKAKLNGDQAIINNIETLSYLIEQLENNIENDSIFSRSIENKNFAYSYLRNLKQQRDCSFSVILKEDEFKLIDERTIQYATCFNDIYDFKIKYIINK
jgi:hypothetical protein